MVCLIFIVSNLSNENILAESVVAVIPFRLSASLLSVSVRGPNVNILLAVGYLQGLCTDIACRTGLTFCVFQSNGGKRQAARSASRARGEKGSILCLALRARARVPRFGPANRSVLQAKVDIFQQEGMKHGCR